MKTLYLDVCAYCRPFDNQEALRIRLETDAIYMILRYIEIDVYRAIASPVHEQEINMIQEADERLKIKALLHRMESPVCDLGRARVRAEGLSNLGFGAADAAHVAFAEQTADVFITCDDKLLKKCRKTQLEVQAMNPIEFVNQEDLK